jgi:hypothetical protein
MGKLYYEGRAKPDLMKDYIRKDMNLLKGEAFTKKVFLDGFSRKYPAF